MMSQNSNYRKQNPCDFSMKFCRCPDLAKSKLNPFNDAADVKCRKKNLGSTAKKLAQLVLDPVTSLNTTRISRYLEDFISLTSNEGFYVKYLEETMCIFEFLAFRAREVLEYKKHLEKMLELCIKPPLLMKTSEGLFCTEILEHYFTLFAYLLLILPTVQEVLVIHEAIHRLLDRTKPAHIAAVKFEICCRAVEASVLPVTVTELLEIATDEIFPRLLETTLLLVSISSKCCYRMMEAGVLEHILIRLDPNYVTRSPFQPSPDIPEDELENNNQLKILIAVTNIMWKILDSVTTLKKLPNDKSGFKPPTQSAMWSLRYAFRREVRSCGRNQSSATMRNDLAAIMLAVLARLPAWKFVESGLAEDLVILAVATELGTENTWASNVRFGNSIEDFRLKKILILIMCHLAKIRACMEIMKQRKLLASILTLVNPDVNEKNIIKDETQFWDLHQYALHALAILLPLMPQEFIKFKGTNRLLMILEWSMSNEFNSRLIINCLKSINLILMNGKKIIQKSFLCQGMIGTIIKVVHFVLSVSVLNSQHQRILTHAMMILENLIKDERHHQTIYGEQSIKMILRMLQRFLYDRTGYFELDDRLAIAMGTFIWECIIWCPPNLKMFVERGAVYAILDVIDASIFPVRLIFLGVLCDICEEGRCETQLCTWRGENKELGLMSLLAKVWREEEIRIKAKRTKDGYIDDLELPLMGVDQWLATYFSKWDHTKSPALEEMMGSCRPKIYAVRKILERNSARYELAKNHYKILLQEIPTEDQITMLIVDHYFRLKQGEIWIEINRDIQRIGILPLRLDSEMIFLMLQNHRRRANFIKSSQEAILKASNDAELREERATYEEIINSKLAPTLDAFREIDYISRTTNPGFMYSMKERQSAEINEALNFPKNEHSRLCHRTFIEKINVTAIMDHQHIIQSEALIEPKFDSYKLMPVSPSISSFTMESVIDDDVNSNLPCRTCFVSDLPCSHR